jgi:hypothetical protein
MYVLLRVAIVQSTQLLTRPHAWQGNEIQGSKGIRFTNCIPGKIGLPIGLPMFGCSPVTLKPMAVCRDINFFLVQRGGRAHIRIAEGKEEFVGCECGSFQRLLTRHSTGGHDQGVEERQNKVVSGRHRVDFGYVVVRETGLYRFLVKDLHGLLQTEFLWLL